MPMLNTPIQSIQLFLYTFSLVLATAAIACRLFARRFTRTKLQWNDWLMLLAYLHVIALGVAANIAVVHGEMGAHQSEIPKKRLLEVFPLNMKMTIIIPFLLSSSSFLVKMSITHFYIVLFPHTVLTRICKVQLCLLTICWLGGNIPFFFTCKPLAYTWNKTLDGSCTDPRDFWLGMSITALFFDLTCVILPIPIVWRLQCSIGKKIRLTLLFGLGLFICIITILRIAKAYTLNFADLTHSAATAVMCAVPEPVLSIVAGCIPITMPLFRHTAHKLRGRTSTSRSAPQSYESRISAQKAPWRMDKHKRLDEHLYPLGSFVADEGSASVMSSPVSARLERSIESLVGVGRLEDRGGRGGGGITVLREVHVDSERVEREEV